jgi:uncharacterized protein
MPSGIVINALSVLSGGLIGGFTGNRIPERLRQSLPTVFGFAAIAMGILKVIDTQNLTVVILSLILGAVVGELLRLEHTLERISTWVIRKVGKQSTTDAQGVELVVMAMVAFCVSGTGIFGALQEGFTGDASILLSKSVLDFSTALIFSSLVGYSIALVSVPQIVILSLVYLGAGLISPLMNPYVLGNFMAVGGIVTLMIGAQMSKMATIKAANAIPAIAIVIVLSLWMV